MKLMACRCRTRVRLVAVARAVVVVVVVGRAAAASGATDVAARATTPQSANGSESATNARGLATCLRSAQIREARNEAPVAWP